MKKKDAYQVAELTALLVQGYEEVNIGKLDGDEVKELTKIVGLALPNVKQFFKIQFQHDKNIKELQRLDSEVEILTRANEVLAEERDNEKESAAGMQKFLKQAEDKERAALKRLSEAEANVDKAIQGNQNLHEACVKKEEQVDKLISLAISLGGSK